MTTFTVSGMIENIRRFHQDVQSYGDAESLCQRLLTEMTEQHAGRDWPYTWTMIDGPNVYQSLILRDGEIKIIDYLKQSGK